MFSLIFIKFYSLLLCDLQICTKDDDMSMTRQAFQIVIVVKVSKLYCYSEFLLAGCINMTKRNGNSIIKKDNTERKKSLATCWFRNFYLPRTSLKENLTTTQKIMKSFIAYTRARISSILWAENLTRSSPSVNCALIVIFFYPFFNVRIITRNNLFLWVLKKSISAKH